MKKIQSHSQELNATETQKMWGTVNIGWLFPVIVNLTQNETKLIEQMNQIKIQK